MAEQPPIIINRVDTTEVFAASYLILWGLIVLLPWTVITTTLGVLLDIAPQAAWGLLSLALGGVRLWALWTARRLLWRLSAGCSIAWYVWFVVSVAQTNPHALQSVMTFALFGVGAGLNLVRSLRWTW